MPHYRTSLIVRSIFLGMGGLILFNPSIMAQNLAVNEQLIQQEAAAIGYRNSVSNTFNQQSIQNQGNPFFPRQNQAISRQSGFQTGIADGVANRIYNRGYQSNIQQQFTPYSIRQIAPVYPPRH